MDVWFEDDFPDLIVWRVLGEPAVNFQRCRAKRDGNFFGLRKQNMCCKSSFLPPFFFVSCIFVGEIILEILLRSTNKIQNTGLWENQSMYRYVI